MATLDNFGQQFASKVLEKTYANAVVEAIANRDYEGEIKKAGDRVNILSFLNDIVLSDYEVGSDMNLENVIDANDQFVKMYGFSSPKEFIGKHIIDDFVVEEQNHQ